MANKRHVTTEETGSNRPLVRRRAVIAAASALVAAAAARAVAPTAAVQAAGDSDDFVLGATNKTLGTTDLDLGGGSGPALLVRSSAGDGIVGQSLAGTSFNSPPPKGIGVLGRLLGPGPPSPAAELALSELSGGVVGFTDVAGGSGGGIELNSFQWGVASGTNLAGGTGGPALVGRSVAQAGLLGLAGDVPAPPITAAIGVLGISDGAAGIVGMAVKNPHGPSPIAIRSKGDGIRGIAVDTAVHGVYALNTLGGVALAVEGRALFSAAGAGTIPAGAGSHSVLVPAVQMGSHVTVTFVGDPGSIRVAWIDAAEGRFTIHLTSATTGSLPFSYLIVES